MINNSDEEEWWKSIPKVWKETLFARYFINKLWSDGGKIPLFFFRKVDFKNDWLDGKWTNKLKLIDKKLSDIEFDINNLYHQFKTNGDLIRYNLLFDSKIEDLDEISIEIIEGVRFTQVLDAKDVYEETPSKLHFLDQLENLRKLRISIHNESDLSVISNLRNLEYLDILSFDLKEFDFKIFNGLKCLKILRVGFCESVKFYNVESLNNNLFLETLVMQSISKNFPFNSLYNLVNLKFFAFEMKESSFEAEMNNGDRQLVVQENLKISSVHIDKTMQQICVSNGGNLLPIDDSNFPIWEEGIS